jgi:hypothetical protein
MYAVYTREEQISYKSGHKLRAESYTGASENKVIRTLNSLSLWNLVVNDIQFSFVCVSKI